MSSRLKKVLTALITAVLVFLITFLVTRTAPFQEMELTTFDQLFELRGPLSPDESPVVLVAISQQAESQIPEGWPWPRDVFAHLVDNLNRAGAEVIGIDVTLEQPDRYAPENDSLFAGAIERHENVVLVGDMRRPAGQHQVQQIIEPYRLLQKHNPVPFGLITTDRDPDGTIRRYHLSRTHRDSTYHSFALELIRQYRGWDDSVQVERHGDYFHFGDYRIPAKDHSSMLINFHGGRGTFTEFPLDNIIDDTNYLTVDDREIFGYEHVEDKEYGYFDEPEAGLLHTDAFEDKIVLVGSTLPDLHDFHATPFATDESMPGYEMHANAVQTILSGNHIYSAGLPVNTAVLLGISILVALIVVYTSPLWGLLLALVLISGYTFGASWMFIAHQYSLSIIAPATAVILGYVGSQTYNYFVSQKEKRRIQNMFGSYVSPALVNQMVESGEEPQLGGTEEYITAFFSDIQSFSAFSEKLRPKDLVALMNEYLTAMTDILTEEGGTLDKYIGDAIVANFGAPVPLEDHAYRACITSQRMMTKQGELRQKWQAEGDRWPEIVNQMQTRIGINTGWMLTGNMGSSTRFNYTMLGDNVNLAARCEAAAKQYGVYTMVTEDTKNEAEKFGDRCLFRFLDRIVVIGRTQPVNVYEIMGLREHMGDREMTCLDRYNEGITHYLNQEWDEAISLFQEADRLEPLQPGETPGVKTNPSRVMSERCEEMKITPPGEAWDGVYEMKSK